MTTALRLQVLLAIVCLCTVQPAAVTAGAALLALVGLRTLARHRLGVVRPRPLSHAPLAPLHHPAGP